VQRRNMAAIYSRAMVCIVAAAGDHADSGLPGFDRPRVKRPPNPTQLAGGLVLGSDLTPPSVVIGETVWSSRGWTYQESMLSRRCIIITESEVFYQCTELTHREGRLKTPAVGDFEFSPVASFPDLLRHCDGGYKGALFALYRNCVKEYTNRRLSYDRDGLIAFQRILSHLERQFGTYMVMGLPWGMMATSLVWDIRGEKLRRRREEKPVGMGVAITSPLLPSWTWAAWEGQVGWGVKVNT
jgi:hypothetical protein